MQPLTPARLAANAYRTLGISASAGQSAIESAARRMRIWPDPARIPPTPWDLPHLGPPSRSRTDLEHAIARLSEPGSRLEDRLLWYHGSRPPAQDDRGAGSLAATITDQHDAAVAALHAASAPAVTFEIARWQQAIARFSALSALPDYLAWLVDVEAEGQFDKRASRAELEEALQSLPGAIVAALVPHAQMALDREDATTCSAILALLRDNQASPQAGDAVTRLVHGLEDVLDAHCRQMDTALRDKLRTNHSAPQPYYPANYEASHDAAMFYNSAVNPALERIRLIAGDDAEVIARANARCSDVLTLLALGWEWSGRFVLADETLQMALGLAEGPAAKEGITKDLERVRPRAEEERRGARPPPLPRPSPTPPPSPPPQRKPKPVWGGVRASTGVLIAILIAASRIVSWWANSNNDSSPPPYRPPTPGNLLKSMHDMAAANAASQTPPDAASIPRDEINSVGETNREP